MMKNESSYVVPFVLCPVFCGCMGVFSVFLLDNLEY